MQYRRSYISNWTHCASVLMAIVLVLGCASTAPLSTPSGRPEVTIQGAPRKQVLDFMVEDMLANGFQLKKVDEYSAVFGRVVTNDFAMSVFYGSRYDPNPEVRVTYNLIETTGGLKV